MPYVSARYQPHDPNSMMPARATGKRFVIAVDEQGKEWHLTEDSEVGDWLRYIKNGGEIKPAVEVKALGEKKDGY